MASQSPTGDHNTTADRIGQFGHLARRGRTLQIAHPHLRTAALVAEIGHAGAVGRERRRGRAVDPPERTTFAAIASCACAGAAAVASKTAANTIRMTDSPVRYGVKSTPIGAVLNPAAAR